MSIITCTCASDIHMSPFPNNCGQKDYGYPKLLLFMKPTGTAPALTVAAFTAAIAAAGDSHVIVVGPITNGQRSEADRQTESGADTIDGLENIIQVQHEVVGRAKFLDETVRADLLALNCYDRLKMWYVTSTDWLFGDTTGYDVANFITGLIQEGYGKKSYVPLSYRWIVDNRTDAATYEAGFSSLINV